MARLWPALALATCGACLDTTPYGPTGFHCADGADCPTGTFCLRQRCEVLSAEPVRPGPGNTGVPPDTALALSGGLSLEQDGAVMDGLDIEGCVHVYARDVVIRRSRIRCGDYYAVRMYEGAENLLLEDVEIDGLGTAYTGVTMDRATGRRLDIHHAETAVNLSSASRLESSYLHHLAGERPVGVASFGGEHMVMVGNTIDLAPSVTGWAVDADGALALLLDMRIERNWVNGGEHTLRLGGRATTEELIASHNRFGRVYGVAPIFIGAGAVQFSNVFDDTGEPLPPP